MSNAVSKMNEMMEKLREVDNVFKFGEKMIPVVEGFVSFISDFIPFIEEVSGSIHETRSKIPEASDQIDRVTNATELAISEVLDKIDDIGLQLTELTEYIDDIVERRVKIELLVSELSCEIKGNEKAMNLLENISSELDMSLIFELMKNKVNNIMSNTDNITTSLQVQDITSQQLAAVNHLIISLQQKLSGLLTAFDATGVGKYENLEHKKLPDVHFDAKASYTPTSNKQNKVGSIINSEKTSQEEIDKLFS